MLRRHWPSLLPWLLVLAVLLAIPFLFYDWSKGRHSGFVLTLMSEIGVMAIFALSLQHADGTGRAVVVRILRVLFGMGAYCAAHVVLCCFIWLLIRTGAAGRARRDVLRLRLRLAGRHVW